MTRRLRAKLLGAGLAALGAVALATPSCGGAGASSAAPACDCCYQEPGASAGHCVAALACRDDDQCPAATTCTSAFAGCSGRQGLVPAPFAGCAASDEGRWCSAAGAGSIPSTVLMTGFGAAELPLTKTTSTQGTAVLSWTAPLDAEVVTCVLFGCAPVVETSSTRLDTDRNPLPEVVNYARCALHAAEFDATSSAFALDGVEATTPDEGAGTCTGSVSSVRAASTRLLTTLAVGCWAYDTARVIAASQLIDIDPLELGAGVGLVTAACADEAGGSCLLAAADLFPGEARVFGSCLGQRCARRCVTALECTPPAAATGAGGSGAGGSGAGGGGRVTATATDPCTPDPGWTCAPLGSDSYLGVCQRVASGAGGAP
jgi:hypothetical protein